MISAKMFDTLEEIGRNIRGNKAPFGGMQVIVFGFCPLLFFPPSRSRTEYTFPFISLSTGDFLQLPPVFVATETSDVQDSLFAFEANSWERTLGVPLFLQQIFRQSDPTFIKHLNKVRIGQSDRETARFFDKLQFKKWKDNVLPTKLFVPLSLPSCSLLTHRN